MKCPRCGTETKFIGRAECNQSDALSCPGCGMKLICVHVGMVALELDSIKERDGEVTGRCLFCHEIIKLKQESSWN